MRSTLERQWTRRRFLLTFGTGAAALLAGCGGGTLGAKINQALGGSSDNGGSDLTGRKKALVYGNASGAVWEEYKSSYTLSVANAGSEPAGYDLLIVHGPSFPSQALKSDSLVQKRVQAGRDIAFLSVTGEQKEAALKGHVLSFTKNDSEAYHVTFTRDANGNPSVHGVDKAACTVGPKTGGNGRGVAETDRTGAALFARLVRGEFPPEMQRAAKTRQSSGDNNGSIPIGAQYALDSQITVFNAAIGPFTKDNYSFPGGQQLYLIASHEIAAFLVSGTGAGYLAVLYTDGFVHSPPALSVLPSSVNNVNYWQEFGYYPVAVESDVLVTTNPPIGFDHITVSGTPSDSVGDVESVTDSASLTFSSGASNITFGHSQTRTLTDWRFDGGFNAEGARTFRYGQQVPYAWDNVGDIESLLAVPLFALGGFAFHTTVTAQTNIANGGVMDFTGAFTGHFHLFIGDDSGTGEFFTNGLLSAPYTLTVDWSKIPTG